MPFVSQMFGLVMEAESSAGSPWHLGAAAPLGREAGSRTGLAPGREQGRRTHTGPGETVSAGDRHA